MVTRDFSGEEVYKVLVNVGSISTRPHGRRSPDFAVGATGKPRANSSSDGYGPTSRLDQYRYTPRYRRRCWCGELRGILWVDRRTPV